MMKICLLLAVLAITVDAGKMLKCTASGDPHYRPFGGKGKKDTYTVMGDGEFSLAKNTATGFEVAVCSKDVSVDRTSSKVLTWNRDVIVKDGDYTVEISGGDDQDYSIKVTNSADASFVSIDEALGIHHLEGTFACDPTAKGKKNCKTYVNNDDILVRMKRKNKNAAQGNSFTIKFKKTHRLVTASIATATKKASKFGVRRTKFNIMVKVPKAEGAHEDGNTGFCYETKDDMKDKTPDFTSLHFADCTTGAPAIAIATDDLLEDELADEADEDTCNLVNSTDVVQKCSDLLVEDMLGCVLDGLEGCTAEDVDDLLQFEVDVVPYNCPALSYIDSSSWPLTSFDDCTCYYGHTRSDDDEACAPIVPIVPWDQVLPSNKACFCDGNSARHCMHANVADSHCMMATKTVGGVEEYCPLKDASCSCPPGSYDCTGKSYTLEFSTAPALAVPGMPFGQQPAVTLRDQDGNIVKDSGGIVRISIANAQSEDCKCGTDTPCLHDNAADNTCFAKQDLWGESVCPAGTTECLPEQTMTKLFQKDLSESESDTNSYEHKTTKCRQTADMDYVSSYWGTTQMGTDSINFCSGMTPCKHQGDGHCMQKTAFTNTDVDVVVETATCKATDFWRRAVPQPTQGWFFETDSTCTMTGTLGCSDAEHSYSMDKWCDHNCYPKFPGQPAFCPESHCDCGQTEGDATTKVDGVPTFTTDVELPTLGAIDENYDWKCPADRYNDGSCRCAAGTEFCGAIQERLTVGKGQFKHLTIGTEGRYQLQAEIVMPDQLVGTNNIRISTKSSVFDVMKVKTGGTQCRAQEAWRQPEMYDSEAHGEGQAWHFEDSKACIDRNADGTCAKVASEPVYAMDTWCKANKCAAFTLLSHCEFFTPDATDVAATCNSAKYDMFGDCCESSFVDACGVCNGDGSTCQMSAYATTPIAYSSPEIVFDASLAHSSCDLKTPCMHLNDRTCGPKTWNSATLTGKDQHCWWDRSATAEDQPNYKHGTWDVEGRLSRSIETQLITALNTDGTVDMTQPFSGNQDCYCPAGTVDISKKLEIEEKVVIDVVLTICELAAAKCVANPSIEGCADHVVCQNSGNVYAYQSDDCNEDEKKVQLSTTTNNILCGTHWEDAAGAATGSGHCWCSWTETCGNTHPTCTNDMVRSIRLPPMTSAKMYMHCDNNLETNPRYETIDNFSTETKCMTVVRKDGSKEPFDTSAIVIEGAVLKVAANIIGTTAVAFESSCMTHFESCKADEDCNDVLIAAESATLSGENFVTALRELTSEIDNTFLQSLIKCSASQSSWVPSASVEETVEETTTTTTTETTEIATQIFQTSGPSIFPVATYDFAATGFERRLVAAGATSGVVQITTSGNQGVVGATSAGASSSAQFATAGASPAGSASSAGVGTAGAVGVAVGCTAIAALAIAFVVQQKNSAQPVASATGNTLAKAAEDHTDVL